MSDTSQPGFAGIVFFLAAVTIPLGSDRPFFWYANAAAVALLTALYLADLQRRGGVLEFSFASVSVAASLMLIAVLWMVIQILPVPLELSPHPIWKEASAVLNRSITPRISVDPAATGAMIARYLTYLLIFFLAAQFSVEPTRRRRLLISVFLITVAQATVGILSLVSGDHILFMEKWAYQGSATGTFVNRNSFATFLAFGLAVGTALMLNELAIASKANASRKHARASPRKARAAVLSLYFLGQVIIGVAILLSGSRMGGTVAVLGVLVVFVMAFAANGIGHVRGVALFLAFGAVGALLLFFAGDEMVRRFGWLDYSTGVRLLLFSQVLDMISGHPWVGYGGGTFETAFPSHHKLPLTAEVTWDTAHNLYLELLADLGVIGAAPILAILALAVGILRSGWRTRGAVGMTSAVAVIGIAAVHSTVDFSLQIEANVVLFLAVVACGSVEAQAARREGMRMIVPSEMPSSAADAHAASSPGRRSVARLEAAAVASIAVATLTFSVLGAWREAAPFISRAASLEERVESITQPKQIGILASAWPTGTARRTTLTDCLATLHDATERLDRRAAEIGALQKGCLGLVKNSIAMAPMSANEWLVAAALASNLGDVTAALLYLKMSYATGPNEQWIAERRAGLAYQLRPNLNPNLLDKLTSDLRLLLSTQTGMRRLERHCVSDPALCRFIVVFARTPPSAQRELLASGRSNLD